MRLSESLRRGIMESSVGGIINKFKGRKRRNILFFEEILANYFKECESFGYTDDVEKIAIKWANLATQEGIIVLKIPATLLFNIVLKKIWINLGLINDMHFEEKDGIITIKTENEYITRTVGENRFAVGAFLGILNIVYDSAAVNISSLQNKSECEYRYKLEENNWEKIRCKEKRLYDLLNYPSGKSGGTALESVVRKNIFQLKNGTQLFFRNKRIIILENTLFHIISNRGIIMEKVPQISNMFFGEIIENDSANEKKMNLLKTLLESMGWGASTILISGSSIILRIKNPPYGIQKEKDNWNFIAQVILGYVWNIDSNYRLSKIANQYKTLEIVYSKK